MAEAALLAASIAVLVGTIALLVRRLRDPARVRDAQLEQNASPVLSLLLLVLGALVVALVLTLGTFLALGGRGLAGWGLICDAAAGASYIAAGIWLRTRPFPDPGADPADDAT